MAGRYRGNRQIPRGSFAQRAGRWLARRGYDLANMLVPGTLFDYRERGTVNPGQAFRDSTVAEIARWARGKPEGMSDEDWARIQQEGREGVFDSAFQLLPIPKIPYVTGYVGRQARNALMGPNSHLGRSLGHTGRSSTRTVVPTVSGNGVTTTEKPVTTTTPAPTDTINSGRNSGRGTSMFPSNSNSMTTGYGGTRGRGVGVADDPSDILDMLGFGEGFGGNVGYRGVTGGIDPWTGMKPEQQDLYNTGTGQQVFFNLLNGAYDAEHQATNSSRVKF